MNDDEINKITGCAMEVHNQMGNSFQEVIYQRALVVEFRNQGLSFARELEMPLEYKGVSIGSRRVDFFMESNARD